MTLILVGFSKGFAQSYSEMITVEDNTFTMDSTSIEAKK